MPTASFLAKPGAAERAREVRLVAFDVDGTLTDGALIYGPAGESAKAFSVRDGFGLNLLRQAGIRIAIVTGRESSIVAHRAADLKFDAVMQGVTDKRAAIVELCRQYQLTDSQTAFVGDDWPDLPALRHAGLAATVTGAPPELRTVAHWIGSAPPGAGAVREFAEWLLAAQGRLDGLRENYLR
jgi:3-deoxy-D-manno-octulosonate 8-phosphate phosphatase (KDO 8-P phosphatase)